MKTMNNATINNCNSSSFFTILKDFLAKEDLKKNTKEKKAKALKDVLNKLQDNYSDEESVFVDNANMDEIRANLCEGLFAYEMGNLKRDFRNLLNNSSKNTITCKCDKPKAKAKQIYKILCMFEEEYTFYRNNFILPEEWLLRTIDDIFSYLMEELVGTSKEKYIKKYTYLFNQTFHS